MMKKDGRNILKLKTPQSQWKMLILKLKGFTPTPQKHYNQQMITLSNHFQNILPSSIRQAQIKFSQRNDGVKAINLAIGNVSLPMHPAMQERMFHLSSPNSPFKDGVVKYTETVGAKEANQAFLNILASSNLSTKGLYSQITDGGSQAMQLAILGTCGKYNQNNRPLLLIDPVYSNYPSIAKRLSIKTIATSRFLNQDGQYSLPPLDKIENLIKKSNPGALVIIPYDNPTGQKFSQDQIENLARLCVKYDLWLISDEAYRELSYKDKQVSSIWALNEKNIPGITGRRISLETSSKVFNACGLRIGALLTDNKDFHTKSVAENTSNLCASAIGQYIFGAIAQLTPSSLQSWYESQRNYYQPLIINLTTSLKEALPGIIVSKPQSSIYSVIDLKNITSKSFQADEFIDYCSSKGSVSIKGNKYTLLLAPMSGFIANKTGKNNARTQMRIAYVENSQTIKIVPAILKSLLNQYTQQNP